MSQRLHFRALPSNRAIVLKNQTCVYCGADLAVSVDTKEHVIGKRFVPCGKLDREWNLIARACRSCNHAKSQLEDDISAITLQPDAWGRQATRDVIRDEEARRKRERSKSRRTGKFVKESTESFDLRFPIEPRAQATFGIASPPHLDDQRVFRLAELHTRAFFYWITYNTESRRGGFWVGGFFPVAIAVRSDWGNSIQRAFMDTVRNWEPRALATGASGYFKIAIRRCPVELCWSWAVEWNENVRVIGFFGDEPKPQRVVDTFPPLQWSTIRHGNEIVRFRQETKLAEADDRLFRSIDSQ